MVSLASAITTLSPSEELIVICEACVVAVRLVLTFVTLAVLASISAKRVLANLSSVTASLAISSVPTALSARCSLSIEPAA